MSKSLGNVVRPLELVERCASAAGGADAVRYFLVRELAWDRDLSFSAARFERRYQADLANDGKTLRVLLSRMHSILQAQRRTAGPGNLLHRLVHMVGRYCGGHIPAPSEETGEEIALRSRCETLPAEVFSEVDQLALNQALALVMEVVGEINVYLERTAPWREAKASRPLRTAEWGSYGGGWGGRRLRTLRTRCPGVGCSRECPWSWGRRSFRGR